MKETESVRVTSPAGTDLEAQFSDHYHWIASNGTPQRGITRNWMPAEVYNYAILNGVFVIDGIYAATVGRFPNQTRSQLIQRFQENPIQWEIEDSVIRSATSRDPKLQHIAQQALEGQNADRIGEFGMGTNFNIQELYANVMHDEKFPGIHLANGSAYLETGIDQPSDIHWDGIARDVTVQTNTGLYILKNGAYNFSGLAFQ